GGGGERVEARGRAPRRRAGGRPLPDHGPLPAPRPGPARLPPRRAPRAARPGRLPDARTTRLSPPGCLGLSTHARPTRRPRRERERARLTARPPPPRPDAGAAQHPLTPGAPPPSRARVPGA